VQSVASSIGANGDLTAQLGGLLAQSTTYIPQLLSYGQVLYTNETASGVVSAASQYAQYAVLLAQLQMALSGITTILSLVSCDSIQTILEDIKVDICEHTTDELGSLRLAIEFTLILMVGCILAVWVHSFIVENPLKSHRCPNAHCGRWFRFKCSLKAHLKVGCAAPMLTRGETLFQKNQWCAQWGRDLSYQFAALLLVCTLQGVFMLMKVRHSH
jgi:hypothetical protein